MYNRLQKEIATTFKTISGYRPVESTKEIIVDGKEGNSTDYVSEKYGKPAFTVETVFWNAKFPLDPKYFEIAYNKIKSIPLHLAKKSIELQDSNYYGYKVYKENSLLKDFNVLNKSKEYAKKYKDTYINEKLEVNEIKINKNGPQTLGTKVNYVVDAKGFNLSYAYQVYKGNERVYEKGYNENKELEFKPYEEGRYKVKVFVKDEVGNSKIIYSSKLDIVETGFKYEYDENDNIIKKYKEDGSFNYCYRYGFRKDGTIDYKIVYNTAGKKIEKYTYNEKSKCKYKYIFKADGTYNNKYAYKDGKIIANYIYTINNEGRYQYKYKYGYKSDGTLYYRYIYKDGKVIVNYIYTKDSNGKYVYKYKYAYKSDGTLNYKYVFKDGKITANYIYTKDRQGRYVYRYKYAYKADGTLNYKYLYKNGKVIANFIYTKDSNGKYVYKYKYGYKADGTLYYKYIYKDGKVIANYIYTKNSKGNYEYKYKYAYDDSGTIKYKYEYTSGKIIAKYTYYIDNNGKYQYKYKYIYSTKGKYYIKRYTYNNGKIVYVKTY